MKCDFNSAFVLRHVISRSEELLASPEPTAPLEILSRTQALLLYAIILFFDGDIGARFRADAVMDRLEDWGRSLQPLTSEDALPPTTKLLYYPTTASNIAWKIWTLRESARRTFVACFFFLSAYHLMKGNYEYCRNHVARTITFTASAHLWSASTLQDFTACWNEKAHFVVRNLDFEEVIGCASADDLDAFGKMLLIAYMGEDASRDWFYIRSHSV